MDHRGGRGRQDPILFFPELMWMRACLDWMPRSMLVGPHDAPAQGVMFLPPMGKPRELPRHREDLMLFYESVGIEG